MVQPIRAVGLYLPTCAPHPLANWLWPGCAPAARACSWASLPLAIRAEWLIRSGWLVLPELTRLAWRGGPDLEVPEWQPWPAQGPRIAEDQRWWPSDEVPQTAPVDSDIPSVPAPLIVVWRERGGLLDMVV